LRYQETWRLLISATQVNFLDGIFPICQMRRPYLDIKISLKICMFKIKVKCVLNAFP
jgi:hypothetical protein